MDSETLTIIAELPVAPQVQARIRSLLEEANTEFRYPRNTLHYCAALRSRTGSVEGGVNAQGYWGWLYVAELVVAPQWRGHGYGRRLLAAAEAWGLENSCHYAWLSTMSFQARKFYEGLDYRVFGELPHFPELQTRFFMRKSLDRARPAPQQKEFLSGA
jgi:GNAT superfamily N-acetyltransferase